VLSVSPAYDVYHCILRPLACPAIARLLAFCTLPQCIQDKCFPACHVLCSVNCCWYYGVVSITVHYGCCRCIPTGEFGTDRLGYYCLCFSEAYSAARLACSDKFEIASTGPKGTRLRVLLNGQELFNGQVAARGRSQTLNLTGIVLGKQAVIELLSDSFVPKDVIQGSVDTRTLGVYVQGIRLLADNSTPLSDR